MNEIVLNAKRVENFIYRQYCKIKRKKKALISIIWAFD